MSSVLGTLFRVATWGESHGGAVGVVIDGCPPRLPLAEADLQPQLDRRRPGQSRLTTPRQEADRVHILSGVFEGRTLGTPILLSVDNTDARPREYEQMREVYRPSHADFTYDAKFGIRNWQGGGRTSARETIGRVAAGAVAEKLLARGAGIEIVACVERIGSIEGRIGLREEIGGGANGGRANGDGATARGAIDLEKMTRKQVDRTPVRCPDLKAAAAMIAAIETARRDGDSLGGVIRAVIRGVPAGLGSPVFDRLEADLAKAMMSLPATKGFEVGSGFAGTLLRGSQHNDAYIPKAGRTGTRTNRSGGIQGGISNGETITMRIAFKPTATIRKPQETVDTKGRPRVLAARGRHDPCVLPRAVPMVEAMAALVLVDHWLRQLVIEESARRIDRSAARSRRR